MNDILKCVKFEADNKEFKTLVLPYLGGIKL